jgi:hypothetical protein
MIEIDAGEEKLVIEDLAVGENESGLVHWAEAAINGKRCHCEFIDMPMFDDGGKNLRMDAVGSMLTQKYYEPPYVEPPKDLKEKSIPVEIVDAEPVLIDPKVVADRRATLAVLNQKAQLWNQPKTEFVKDW